jgi:hypothetical protein
MAGRARTFREWHGLEIQPHHNDEVIGGHDIDSQRFQVLWGIDFDCRSAAWSAWCDLATRRTLKSTDDLGSTQFYVGTNPYAHCFPPIGQRAPNGWGTHFISGDGAAHLR